jgi:hypothetical protein
MKTSRYSDAQILSILRQADGGVPVADLCREHGMSTVSPAGEFSPKVAARKSPLCCSRCSILR